MCSQLDHLGLLCELMGVGHKHSRNLETCLYQKLTPMHVTKIVRFDWSVCLKVSGTRDLQRIELRSIRCNFLVHVSVTSFFSVCHLH